MNEAKFKEAIVYICGRCSEAKSWGRVKLVKILFYADFESFELHGESITGAKYFKLEQGPVPTASKVLQDQMVLDRDIAFEVRPVFDYVEQRPVALREPDMSVFSGEDVRILDRAIDRLKPMTAKKVSEFSHRHPGWLLVEMGAEIPYEAALLTQDHERTLSDSAIRALLGASRGSTGC